MKYWIVAAFILTLSACGSNPPAAAPATAEMAPTALVIARATEQATIVPAATATVIPTLAPVAIAPTGAPTLAPETPAARYIAIAQAGVTIPTVRPGDMSKGEWKADVIDNGSGPEVTMTMPVGIGLSKEQLVRQAKRQVAQAVKAIFDADPAVARVSVTGTLPDGTNGAELGAVLISVERATYAKWDGLPDHLGNWRIPQRYQ